MKSHVRSGCVVILAIFFAASYLSQTDPRMIVAWDPIPDPDCCSKYVIETTVGTLPYAKAADCQPGSALSGCTVAGIEGTTTYKIRVAGVDKSGSTGGFSDPITFMFASVQPLSPTSLSQSSAPNDPGMIGKKLSWPAVTKFRTGPLLPSGKVEYRVYQAMTGPAVIVATTTANSFAVQLAKHKSYQFFVTCFVNGVESYTSPAVRVNT